MRVLYNLELKKLSSRTFKNKDKLGTFDIFQIKNNQTKSSKNAHCAQKDRKVFKINQTKI
jgi:hypothetical protein